MTPTWPNPATATNLGELLTNTARRLGNRTALITSERTTTWTELDQRVDSAVAELRSSGVGPGSTMLVHAANSQRLFESMWTAFKLGAGWAPANPKLTAAELEHLASVVRPDVYLGNSTDQGHLDSVLRAHPDALFVDGVDGWDYLASTHPEPAIIAAGVDPSTPAWLFSTSGTTGRPKAAILTHTQLAYVVTSHLAEVFPRPRRTRHLTYHLAALTRRRRPRTPTSRTRRDHRHR